MDIELAEKSARFHRPARFDGNYRRHQSSLTVDYRAEFGVESALGASDRLGLLATGRVAAELVQLDVRAIDEAHASRCAPAQQA